MPKTITLRLSDDEYTQIAAHAAQDRRTISNFIINQLLSTLKPQPTQTPIPTQQTSPEGA